MIATLQDACGGDLKRVKRIVKVLSLVNSTGDFTEHHLVTMALRNCWWTYSAMPVVMHVRHSVLHNCRPVPVWNLS